MDSLTPLTCCMDALPITELPSFTEIEELSILSSFDAEEMRDEALSSCLDIDDSSASCYYLLQKLLVDLGWPEDKISVCDLDFSLDCKPAQTSCLEPSPFKKQSSDPSYPSTSSMETQLKRSLSMESLDMGTKTSKKSLCLDLSAAPETKNPSRLSVLIGQEGSPSMGFKIQYAYHSAYPTQSPAFPCKKSVSPPRKPALGDWQALSHRVVSAARSDKQETAWTMLRDCELERFLMKVLNPGLKETVSVMTRQERISLSKQAVLLALDPNAQVIV
jgi:hypothetical protein